ncbi:MAG TPA: prepilin-type N-terminal cleavage/methylation domain-containing protein [Candidatus Saccharimonadales bacterium]|nr:prepilin-type N-terminal cleavage/methylation domain-containing protein [Candidatus Saccharimonadales bacterium]
MLRRIGLPRIRLLDNRGDTIIEVMIVLAVLGMALGISYATANRSLSDARQAQENSQATALLQAQAESLRSMAGNPSSSPDNIYRAGSFCVGDDGHVTTSNCSLGEASRYKVDITWGGAATDTFVIKASWEDVSGDITDTNTLIYRVHKPVASAPTTDHSCPPGYTGTYPACVPPDCPSGYTGTYPACVPPPCPAGWSGIYPACVPPPPPPTCTPPETGTYPDCGTCPWYATGVYPDCRSLSL